jgi:hypothetical protein
VSSPRRWLVGQDSKPEEEFLQQKLSNNGREALRALCADGCNYEELAGLFAWLARFKVVRITCTGKAKIPTEADPIKEPVTVDLDSRVLDRRNTAYQLGQVDQTAKGCGTVE